MSYSRIIENQLLVWKDSVNRKPLIIRGARQVGKTTVIKTFAKEYDYAISLNLEKPLDKDYFENFNNVQNLLEALLLSNNMPSSAIPKTLLFIDEIQECPKAIGMLRYFFEEIPALHVICAGSLLEFAIKDITNFPVGRVTFLYLHPFNFQEYLAAHNKHLVLAKFKIVPVSETAHSILMESFHRYAIIGGMPEIIKTDIELQQIIDLSIIYESIWETYKNDVVKYTKNDTDRKIIKHIVNSAALFIDKRVTFQGFGNSNYKSREVGEAFRALDAAKIIQIIYPTTDTKPPLKSDLKKSPKLQFLDTGLVNYSLGIQSEMLSMKDMSSAYRGSIIPHLVIQEIISLQISNSQKPNFWVREKLQSNAEVDLIYAYKTKAIPIEIKSGTTGSLKSLHQFIESTDHPYAIRMYAGPFKIETTMTPNKKPYILMNMPYYLTTMLPEYIEWFVNNHAL